MDLHHETDQENYYLDTYVKKGKKQRKRLTKYFEKKFPKSKPALFSSPFKRCVQTLDLISDDTKTEIQIHADLVEFEADEKPGQFKVRVKKALSEILKSKADVIALCSHGDWIPMATLVLSGTQIELDKGGWIEYEVDGTQASLRYVIQEIE